MGDTIAASPRAPLSDIEMTISHVHEEKAPLPPMTPVDVDPAAARLGPPTVQSPEPLSATSSVPPSPISSDLIGPSTSTCSTTSTSTTSFTKPRSDSNIFQSIRPAPESPASSRRASQTLSPQQLPAGFPTTPGGTRDRASSTSSSRGGRRVSRSNSHRNSSRPRPRSSLGASSLLASDNGETDPTPTESSLATIAIPEDSVPVEHRPDPPVYIRDYAFEPTDPRFNGPGFPLSAPEATRSRRSSRWGDLADSPEPASGLGSRKASSGWSGFGLLSWRGFMDRRRGSTASGASRNDEDPDYPLPVPDADADDYAFSDSEDEAEEDDAEPWGFYRAAFPFESMGEHEIGLEEGDIVEVRGRGGGDGWVICVKRRLDHLGRVARLDEDGEEPKLGLCPEGYLEKAFDYEVAPPALPNIAEHELLPESALEALGPTVETLSVPKIKDVGADDADAEDATTPKNEEVVVLKSPGPSA